MCCGHVWGVSYNVLKGDTQNTPPTSEVFLKGIDGLGDIGIIEGQTRRVTCGLLIFVVVLYLLLSFYVIQHVFVNAGHVKDGPLDALMVHAKESK